MNYMYRQRGNAEQNKKDAQNFIEENLPNLRKEMPIQA